MIIKKLMYLNIVLLFFTKNYTINLQEAKQQLSNENSFAIFQDSNNFDFENIQINTNNSMIVNQSNKEISFPTEKVEAFFIDMGNDEITAHKITQKIEENLFDVKKNMPTSKMCGFFIAAENEPHDSTFNHIDFSNCENSNNEDTVKHMRVLKFYKGKTTQFAKISPEERIQFLYERCAEKNTNLKVKEFETIVSKIITKDKIVQVQPGEGVIFYTHSAKNGAIHSRPADRKENYSPRLFIAIDFIE